VKVKICGITNKEDALMAVDAGADVIGAVVEVPVKSPRKVTFEAAREIFSSVPVFVSTVAVVMPDTIRDVERIVNDARPGIIQLQGYESAGFVSEIKNKFPFLKIIKVVHIESGESGESGASGESGGVFAQQKINEILNEIKDYEKAGVSGVVLDTKTESGIGGTGKVHNWDLSKIINENINLPLILAGGLNPGNVRRAVELVNPYAVDVSSGVESVLCKKDRGKVESFISEARKSCFL